MTRNVQARPRRSASLPCRWPILIATKDMLFRGQDTSSRSQKGRNRKGNPTASKGVVRTNTDHLRTSTGRCHPNRDDRSYRRDSNHHMTGCHASRNYHRATRSHRHATRSARQNGFRQSDLRRNDHPRGSLHPLRSRGRMRLVRLLACRLGASRPMRHSVFSCGDMMVMFRANCHASHKLLPYCLL